MNYEMTRISGCYAVLILGRAGGWHKFILCVPSTKYFFTKLEHTLAAFLPRTAKTVKKNSKYFSNQFSRKIRQF